MTEHVENMKKYVKNIKEYPVLCRHWDLEKIPRSSIL